MRLFLFVLCLAASAAQAEDCKLPQGKNEELKGVIDFSKCIQERVAALETENTALREELDGMRKTLAGFPGELVNTNGRETRTGGERLTRASYSIASRIGGNANYLAIDDAVAGDLCAQGCTLSLQLSWDGAASDATTPTSLGPCTFRYNGRSGAWSLDGCGAAVSGVDGNDKATGEAGGEAVAALGTACLLADAEPSRQVDTTTAAADKAFGRDRGKSLFLIAATAGLAEGSERFRCELKLAQ